MSDFEVIGWIDANGPMCESCKDKLPENEKSDAFPLFEGSVEDWLNPETRGLMCYTCHEKELWEEDESYSEQYRLLKDGTIGLFSFPLCFWCMDCAFAAPKDSGPLTLHEGIIRLLALDNSRCENCDGVILEEAQAFVKRFERDWGDVENVLLPWSNYGFLLSDEEFLEMTKNDWRKNESVGRRSN